MKRRGQDKAAEQGFFPEVSRIISEDEIREAFGGVGFRVGIRRLGGVPLRFLTSPRHALGLPVYNALDLLTSRIPVLERFFPFLLSRGSL